ncbi:Terpene synthase 6, chloroplastic (Fragment) [Linum grandiflorum]
MKTGFCYFTALATFLEPELFEARSLFTKHSILVSLVDDLFDMFGTPEEHLNLVHLIEIRWNPRGPTVEFASERVETLYWALHHTINETVELAYHTTGAFFVPELYFIGDKLSEEMFNSEEYKKLFEITTTCGRLLNDRTGYEVCK